MNDQTSHFARNYSSNCDSNKNNPSYITYIACHNPLNIYVAMDLFYGKSIQINNKWGLTHKTL